jgi:hypothetical protein
MSYLVIVPHEVGCMLQEHVSRLLDVDPWGKRKRISACCRISLGPYYLELGMDQLVEYR